MYTQKRFHNIMFTFLIILVMSKGIRMAVKYKINSLLSKIAYVICSVNAAKTGNAKLIELGIIAEGLISGFCIEKNSINNWNKKIKKCVKDTINSNSKYELSLECTEQISELFSFELSKEYLRSDNPANVIISKIRDICSENDSCEIDTLNIEEITSEIIRSVDDAICNDSDLRGLSDYLNNRDNRERLINYINRNENVNNTRVRTNTLSHPISGKYYCARNTLLNKIEKSFKTNNVVFISGISGMGKSELARGYANKLGYKHVVSIRLNEDGCGTLEDVLLQIGYSDFTELNRDLTQWGLECIVIVDNFNSYNIIINSILELFKHNHILITSQICDVRMEQNGVVIKMGGDKKESTEWLIPLFKKYSGIKNISNDNMDLICEIAELIGFHTMLICHLALLCRHIVNKKTSLHSELIKIKSFIEAGINDSKYSSIHIDMQRDEQLINHVAPYELILLLFSNILINRRFSEIERQLLGTIILLEEYTSDTQFIRELAGDSDSLGCVKVQDAIISLKKDHIIEETDTELYVHPLIKLLLEDDSMMPNGTPIAELSNEFVVHLMRNKLIEKRSIDSDFAYKKRDRDNSSLYYSMVLDVIHRYIIPEFIVQNKLPANIEDKDYVIAITYKKDSIESCKGVFINYFKKSVCLIDGSKQDDKNYRYYEYTKYPLSREWRKSNIIECNVNKKNYVVPNKLYNHTPVSNIASWIFRKNNSIQSATVSEGIKVIEYASFLESSSLKSIKLPNSLEVIRSRAFQYCQKLESVKFGKGLKSIELYAFSNCINLQMNIIFGDCLRNIDRFAFSHTGITGITFPDSLIDMGKCCFMNCENLQEITFGKGLKTIPYQAFFECKRLKSINLPGSLDGIEGEAFALCNDLEKVVVEEGVKFLQEGAFFGCRNLKEVWLPQSIVSIGRNVFSECENAVIHVYENSLAAKELERYSIHYREKTQLAIR